MSLKFENKRMPFLSFTVYSSLLLPQVNWEIGKGKEINNASSLGPGSPTRQKKLLSLLLPFLMKVISE